MDRNSIIQFIQDNCPYKNGLKINETKAGTHSIFLYGVRAMQLSFVSKCETISFDTDKVVEPAQYSLTYKELKSPEPNIRYEIHSEFDLILLQSLIENTFHKCRDEASFDSFGCCSSFKECSDAGHCLHTDDPDYWGCQYKRNLEKGRIFYGKNKTI